MPPSSISDPLDPPLPTGRHRPEYLLPPGAKDRRSKPESTNIKTLTSSWSPGKGRSLASRQLPQSGRNLIF